MHRILRAAFDIVMTAALAIAANHPFVMAGVTLACAATAVQAQGRSDIRQDLVGHWRSTTLVFGSPRDENLILNANGVLEYWTATPLGRSGSSTGTWRADGAALTVTFGGQTASRPFTFHQGQLVLPNIPNQRGFWEKIR